MNLTPREEKLKEYAEALEEEVKRLHASEIVSRCALAVWEECWKEALGDREVLSDAQAMAVIERMRVSRSEERTMARIETAIQEEGVPIDNLRAIVFAPVLSVH